jgi:hypothetical protein
VNVGAKTASGGKDRKPAIFRGLMIGPILAARLVFAMRCGWHASCESN